MKKECIQCGVKYIPTSHDPKRQKFCSRECSKKYWQGVSGRVGMEGYTEIPSASVGAMAELFVCYELLHRGWSPFRAISASAPCDIIALKDKRVIRIEVRTGYKNKLSGNVWFPREKRDKGKQDVYAVMLHKTREIVFYPKFEW